MLQWVSLFFERTRDALITVCCSCSCTCSCSCSVLQSHLQYVARSLCMLRCVAVCCSVLQSLAVRCLHSLTVCVAHITAFALQQFQCVAVTVAVCCSHSCSALQSHLQCVAVTLAVRFSRTCSVLQSHCDCSVTDTPRYNCDCNTLCCSHSCSALLALSLCVAVCFIVL